MDNKKLFPIIVLLVYLSFALFSIRFLLVNEGTIGHNWDWVVPAMPEYFDYIMKIVKYSWFDRVLGEPMLPLAFSTKIWFLSLALTGKLLFGFKVSQVIVLSTIVISGMSMFFLLKEVLGKPEQKDSLFYGICCFFGGFFYAFSPFLYADFIGGSGGSFQTYAIFPLVFLFFIKANKTCKDKRHKLAYIFLGAAVLSVIALNLHNLFFAFLLLGFYPLVSENRLNAYKKLFLMLMVFFLINLYWIVPLGMSQVEVKQYTSQETVLTLDNIISNVPDLTQIMVGSGYIRNFYDYSINPAYRPAWHLFSFMLVGLVFFFSRLKSSGRLRKESLFWIAVFALSIIMVTGGKEPLGDHVLWLFKNVPFFKFFRSPQFTIILPTFSLALLAGIGLKNMILNIKAAKARFAACAVIFALLLVWVHPSFVSGDLGMEKLYSLEKDRDHIDLFRLSDEHKKVYRFLNAQQDDFKVLWLPMQTSFYYLNTSYQKENEGLDPHVLFSPHSPIFVDHAYYEPSKSFVWFVEDMVCRRNFFGKKEVLFDIMNAKYIVLRKDVEPVYSSCRGWWDKIKIEEMLDDISLDKIFSGEYLAVYRNDDYLKHIYAVNMFSVATDTEDAVKEIEKAYFDPREIVLFSEENPINLLNLISKKRYAADTIVNKTLAKLVLSGFEDGEGWENGANDLMRHTEGAMGFKAKSVNSGMARIQRYVNLNLSLFDSHLDEISIDVYVKDIRNMHPNGFVLFLDSRGDNKDIFFHDPRRTNFKTGWNRLTVKKDEFKKIGSPSWGRIRKLGIDVYSDFNRTLDITFDNWVIYRNSSLKIDKFRNRKQDGVEVYDYSSLERSDGYMIGAKKPSIEFEKISPVKYRVKVRGDSPDPFFLVFLESYHPGWNLYKGNANWITSFLKQPNKVHLTANMYANAWYIEDDGSGDYTIYYMKQGVFILFLLASLIFLFLFAWGLFRWVR